MRTWLIFTLSIFFLLGCDPESKTKTEICNNGADDDGDGHIDCADPGCYGQEGGPTGQVCQSTESRCDDAFDNDADGQADCADTDCAASCGGVEDCDNDADDDGDGDIDCDDADCDEDPACTGGEICDNGQDDDGDEDVDCDDADCAAAANCLPVEDCDDGIDNDGDTLADCADSDCLGQQGAGGLCQATEAACNDSFDNDADGDVDCTDDDCAGAANCQGPVEDCDVVGDEDGDGDADCLDPECNNQAGPGGGTCQTTETSCADSYDNDGDGDADCADSDCAAECVTAGSLVITEFIRDPGLVTDANGEWFEIKNTSGAAIDLRGLVIFSAGSTEQTHVITSANPVTVAPGAYLVLATNADPATNGGLTVGYAYGSSIGFNNSSDDSVGLRTAGGTIIDEVLFPVATFPNTAGKAMSLDPAHTTAADNNNVANWCVSKVMYNSADYGTPGAANPSCAAEADCANTLDDDGNGQTDCADFACANAANCSSAAIPTAGSLIVTELMLNPGIGTPDYQYEWIEIKNVSAQAVELNGLTLCSDAPSVFCSSIHFGVSTPLAAGASALFMSDATLWTSFVGIKYSYGSDIRLDNAAEGVQLYHGATLIDAVAYGVGWPISTVGRSIQFSSAAAQDATANDSLANWCVGAAEYDAVNHLWGTPGVANVECVVATETCNDTTDNDSDGLVDCADPDCVGQTGPGGITCQATESTCNDVGDNDGDGLTDCADPNCAGLPGPGGANCPAGTMTLFFSEYIEGSGTTNKALEIYNPFGTAYDLAANTCQVKLYVNGSPTATTANTATLTGSIAPGDVLVLCRSDATGAILAACDFQHTAVNNFNGDDAIELVCNGITLDVIGQIGFDPGTEWVVGGVSTLNQTLQRKCGINSGDTNGGDAYDPSLEWNTFAQDTFSGLGSHTVTCK